MQKASYAFIFISELLNLSILSFQNKYVAWYKISSLSASLINLQKNNSLSDNPSSIKNLLWFLIAILIKESYLSVST